MRGNAMVGVAGPPMLLINIVAFIFAVGASTRSALNSSTRRAWGWFAAAIGLLIASAICFAVFTSWRQFPAPGDLLRLAFTPMMLVGLLLVPRRLDSRLSGLKLGLDAGVIVVAGVMVMWYVAVGPALTEHRLGTGAVLAAIALPLGDLTLLFGIVLVLMRGVDESVRRPMILLAAAMTLEMVGDMHLGGLRLDSGFRDVYAWQFMLWLTGHFLIAAAAFEQSRSSSRNTRGLPRRRAFSVAPYFAVALGLALLVISAVRGDEPYRLLGMVFGSVVLTCIVVTRQVMTLWEVHKKAVTDGLTGLANRTHTYEALEWAMARTVRGGPPAGLLLADLNEFKQVNDTLGHAAGDRLLIEFARMLRRAVLGSDVAGRLGGDEFAVVLTGIGSLENAEAVVRRLRREMEQPVMIGDVVVQIRAAIGLGIMGPGDVGTDALVARADEAMYENKRAIRRARDLAPQAYE
ncbi:GGDEF domain-containing protein [Actinoplanes sp. NBC_00393]|uniref:GGDEF domain-containing protein n=1 Tax=Actinoplanes sp. NBC_00393 TaxID=2975953 RepID=UPI002E23CE7B